MYNDVIRILCLTSVILTGSADCSILATDVETGSSIERLENAHEFVFVFSSPGLLNLYLRYRRLLIPFSFDVEIQLTAWLI